MRQRLAGDRLVELARHRGELGEDVAAALRLAVEKRDVVGMAARRRPSRARVRVATRAMVASGVPSSCAAAAASPSSAERCCSRASTISVALRARGELPGLLGDAEGVDAGEGAGRDQRHPDADRYRSSGSDSACARVPGKGQVADGEHRRDHDDDRAEEHGRQRRKRRRRDDHRDEEEDGERVLAARR